VDDLLAAQGRLRRQLDFTRTVTKSLGEGVLALNASGRMTFMNPAAERMLGWKAVELLGRVVHDVIHFKRADGSRVSRSECAICRRCHMQETSYSDDDVFVRADGTAFPVSYSASPIRDGDRITGAVLSFRDLTTQKRNEAENAALFLREQRARAEAEAAKERLHAVIDASPLPIATLDGEERVTMWNGAAERTFGWSCDEVVGQLLRTIPHDDEAQWSETLERARNGETVSGLETRWLCANGTALDVIASVAPLRGTASDVTGYVVTATDITARKRAEEALEYQAMHDALTSLPNRLLLQDRLQQAMRRAIRDTTPFALLFMDLDRFKDVNDTYGHHTGDLLLRGVAARLRGALRESDTVARLGGDEFAVVLPNSDVTEAALIADKLLAALESPIEVEGRELVASASIGIAAYPRQANDVTELMQHADAAMYLAKHEGLGRSVYADSSVDAEQKVTG